jgi:hypothetical protein
MHILGACSGMLVSITINRGTLPSLIHEIRHTQVGRRPNRDVEGTRSEGALSYCLEPCTQKKLQCAESVGFRHFHRECDMINFEAWNDIHEILQTWTRIHHSCGLHVQR